MAGLCDLNLLESAIMMPQFSLDGYYVHGSIHSMGAAYIFHIIKDHPFFDGNKRTRIVSGITFLKANGIIVERSGPQMVDLASKVATNAMNKEQITHQLLLLSKNSIPLS